MPPSMVSICTTICWRTWAARPSRPDPDLGGFARRLAAIDPARLTDTERLERPALEANIRSRLFELEEVRTWERSLSTTPTCWPRAWPARSCSTTPRWPSAPAGSIRSCARSRGSCSRPATTSRILPGIYLKVGLESLRGTLRFINDDLPRAFGDLGDLHLLGDLADASTEAATAIGALIDYFEKDLAPRSKGSFRLGREKFEQKLQLDEGITLGADRLLAIATRELQRDAGGVPPRRRHA